MTPQDRADIARIMSEPLPGDASAVIEDGMRAADLLMAFLAGMAVMLCIVCAAL